MNFILIIAKQLAVTINKNNTTAVSAASKPHSRLLKSKTFISKWMFPASTKKRFNPIAAIEYETSNLNNLYLWMNIPMNPIKNNKIKESMKPFHYIKHKLHDDDWLYFNPFLVDYGWISKAEGSNTNLC